MNEPGAKEWNGKHDGVFLQQRQRAGLKTDHYISVYRLHELRFNNLKSNQ